MNRQAVQAALGRGSIALDSCRASITNTSTAQFPCIASISRRRQPFSTTTARSDEDRPSSQQRSRTAATQLGQLAPRPLREALNGGAPNREPHGLAEIPGIVTRSQGGDPSKIINMRSLRGSLGGRGGRGGRGAGGDRGGRLAPRVPGTGVPYRAEGTRGGRGRGAARGRGRGGRGGRGGADGKKRAAKKKGPDSDSVANQPKLVWNPEEQALVNRIEQGVVTDYTPAVTLKTLSGYGPAVATDASLGKVELALRSMRIMGGGQAFNSDAGVTVDYKAMFHRYRHERKPVFFNSAEEKAWLESSKEDFKVARPAKDIKTMIIETAILGKYDPPSFVDMKDTVGTLENYHGRTFSYTASNSEAFIEKVQSLLPAQSAPKAQAKRA
ncbi:hypothetical protein B0T25DRAFT_329789 [Lasiosphaeria hispida]|uniref:Uncharacterized protein n=1 Tax=Lasiosphaeria hispida TaxID=260671 RepID=A0AAJ0M7Y9_9PEZI|nr:hypothetical protein B0T25DRAFT_329789 [Lasiosphaeria hispida]